MEKLTEAELAALPERGAKAGKWANAMLDWRADDHPDCDDCQKVRRSLWENDANRTAYLCHELARALTPLPCGHPGACVVSVPYIGENKSNHCGWCIAEGVVSAERDELHQQVTAMRERIVSQNFNLKAWIDYQDEVEARLSDFREKLKAADADLEGSIEFNRDVAAENLKLEADLDGLRAMIAEQVKLTARYKRERNALRGKYSELPPGESPWCYPATDRDALREKLKETDDELGRLRLNEAAYLRGQEEIVRDQDNLRARFKAAEGLAEAITDNGRLDESHLGKWWPDKVREDRGYSGSTLEMWLRDVAKALTAWKAAND